MKKWTLSDGWYTALKYIVMIVLPAVSVLIATLGEIWSIPNVSRIVLTINAVTVFAGSLIGVSGINYNKNKGEDE